MAAMSDGAIPDRDLPLAGTSVKIGDVLGGKYRIDGQLGAGGMGVVLSATHLELEAPVAIKVVRDELARNEEVVARMLFEARAAAKLRSSHVVRVLDVARLPSGAPYIVMERLLGCDLATVLANERRLPAEEAVDYLLQACDGLLEAHALGIIHRDLKPENLFRASTPEGFVVKVLDFGISKDTASVSSAGPRSVMTNAGSAIGSPYYMSPEQMRASLPVDARADIWSLGTILFELLSGRCPFEGDTLPVVCAKVLDEAPPDLSALAPDVPDALKRVVERCLQKSRDERYASVEELAQALRELAGDGGRRSIPRRLSSASAFQLKSERASSLPTPPPASATIEMPQAVSKPSAAHGARLAAGFVALVALVGAAFAYSGSRRASPPSAAAAPPFAAATLASSGPPSSSAPLPALPMPAAPTLDVPRSATAARPRKPRAVAAAAVAVPQPAPSVAAPVGSTPSAVPGPRPSADAWDPSRLGGRY